MQDGDRPTGRDLPEGEDGRVRALEVELAAVMSALADARRECEMLRRERADNRSIGGRANELQHRVRNTIAVIRSIFGRTVDTGLSAEDAIDHFRGRLDALARTQIASAAYRDGSLDLEAMIRDELLTVGFSDGPRVSIEGPPIKLRDKAAELLGLALHELTTNTIKFGALTSGRSTGLLRITWDVADGDLRLRWRESGVAIVSPAPLHAGFGRELVEEALPYQLGARTEFVLLPGGLSCTISVPAIAWRETP